MYRYALAISGSAVDAEDITQTTFAEAYWALQGRMEPRSPRKWLIDIAHEICRLRYDRGESVADALTDCAESELAISLQADGRLGRATKRALAAHLRTCRECVAFVDDLQAQRAAWKELAQQPVPASLGASKNPGASLPARRHLIQ